MSSYPVALIWGIAAGRETDLLAALEPHMVRTEDGLLRITQPEGVFTFAYKRVVSESGIDSVTIPVRPSSGTAGKWHFYIIQPISDTRRVVTVELRDRLVAWTPAPTAGKWHLLGPYTPADFHAVAPSAIWDACVHSWWTIWRAESSGAGVAAQQGYGDADLDREEDPEQ